MNEELERKAFEHWLTKETEWGLWRTNYPMTPPEEQQYVDYHTNLAWMAWQARAKKESNNGR